MLILSSLDGTRNITYLLSSISERYSIPLSTLKSSAKILRELKLIELNGSPVKLTETGRLVLECIGGVKDG